MNHDSNIILQYVYKYKLLINRGTTPSHQPKVFRIAFGEFSLIDGAKLGSPLLQMFLCMVQDPSLKVK